MHARLMDLHLGPRGRPFLSDFGAELLHREQRFFMRLGSSDLSSFGIEEEHPDLDTTYMRRRQRKIATEALRRAYVSKYRAPSETRLRDEAFQMSHWTGMDWVVLPPLLGTYVYYRGFHRTFSIGSTRL